MADIQERFPVLANQTTDAGESWHLAAENDAASGLNAGAVLPAKDESGNIRYIPIVDNSVSVTFASADIANLWDQGDHAGDKDAYQTLASITLQNDYTYRQLEFYFSCFRESNFEVVFVDDSAETVILKGRVGPGQYDTKAVFDHIKFVAGATGTQTLLIRGKNLNTASAMSATLAIEENQ